MNETTTEDKRINADAIWELYGAATGAYARLTKADRRDTADLHYNIGYATEILRAAIAKAEGRDKKAVCWCSPHDSFCECPSDCECKDAFPHGHRIVEWDDHD